jgi:hypothetical protein
MATTTIDDTFLAEKARRQGLSLGRTGDPMGGMRAKAYRRQDFGIRMPEAPKLISDCQCGLQRPHGQELGKVGKRPPYAFARNLPARAARLLPGFGAHG